MRPAPVAALFALVACSPRAPRPASEPLRSDPVAAAAARESTIEPPAPGDPVSEFIDDALDDADHLFTPIECAPGDAVCEDVEVMRWMCVEDEEGGQCNELSNAYHLGKGVPKDWRKSGDAAAAGCYLDFALACTALANAMDLGGYGDDVDRQISRRIYETECFRNDEAPWACFGLARWIGWFGGDRMDAIRALERGVAVDPTFDFLREKLECMRAHPELSAFKCDDTSP